MSNMSVRLPGTFIDAKGLIEQSLESNHRISLRNYGAMFAIPAEVVHYSFGEPENEEGYANMDMTIIYRYPKATKDDFVNVEKTRILRVLNTEGDNLWTHRTINKIWEGDYPSTVAFDIDTGDVFLVGVKLNRLELTAFGVLEPIELETVLEELHDREPFRIIIDPDAMFEYISEAEGINHLKSHIVVEFKCGVPIHVKVKRLAVF